jgi:predicted phosphodiesterase
MDTSRQDFGRKRVARRRLEDTLRIIQCSDLHFSPTPDAFSGLERAWELMSAQEPDLVVIAGDLTHDGLTEQFEPVLRLFERFGLDRVRAVPGNRDYPARNSPVERPVDSDLEYFLSAPDTVFTDHEIPGLPQFATPFTDFFPGVDFFDRFESLTMAGLDSEPQIADDAFNLAIDHFQGSSSAVPRAFCTHRSLLPIPRKKVKDGDLLKNAADILDSLIAADVSLVMCGHVHRAHAWRLSGLTGRIVVSNSPSLIDSSGSKENGFLLIDMDADGDVSIDLHTLDPGKGRPLIGKAKESCS